MSFLHSLWYTINVLPVFLRCGWQLVVLTDSLLFIQQNGINNQLTDIHKLIA